MRILIADDDEVQAELLKKVLKRRFDATVMIANSMEETKSIVRDNNLDFILLDLGFPDCGIDETIEKEIPRLAYPVFVYTGFDDPDLRERTLSAGAQDFIVKASGNASLIERIAHSQFRRTGDKALLKGAYQARHDAPKEVRRLEWKGTAPRVVASFISVAMFVAGLFTGTWALGKFFGTTSADIKAHFARLDAAIFEIKESDRLRDNEIKSREAIIAELSEKSSVSIKDRYDIREQMRNQNDLVIDWLKRIETKVDNLDKNRR